MNKAELVEKIASETGFTKTIALNTINSFTSSVIATLKKENRVSLKGFGTFIITKKSERNRRDY